jgi:predicted porin
MALQGDTNYNSTADLKVSVSSISGEATFGNSIFFGSYSKANNNASSQVSIKSNQLGARYLLSKRTDAYYIIGSNTISVSGSTNYVKQSGNIIGIRHYF